MAITELSEKLSAIQQARFNEQATRVKREEDEKNARKKIIDQLNAIFPDNIDKVLKIPTVIADRPGFLTLTSLQGRDRYFKVGTEISESETVLLSIKESRAYNTDLANADMEYLNTISEIISKAAEVLSQQNGSSSRNGHGSSTEKLQTAPLDFYKSGDIPI